MRDDQEGRGALARRLERVKEVLWVEGGEAFVEEHQVRTLEERSREKETALLPMRELPSAFSDHLHDSGRHPSQQVAEAELFADCFRLLKIGIGDATGFPHQQVEGEWARDQVVFMELRRHRNSPTPAGRAERRSIQTVGEHQP